MIEGIKPREYQQKIFETCKKKNCLVVLPTGMGKTVIALMLAVERQKEFPSSKVLFLAPTRPLAEQHFKYFKKYLPELYGQFELFTGKVNAKKRKELWQKADVIFSTPQCIANDLRKERINLNEVSLLIEDECVTKDTKIKLSDGNEINIGKLFKDFRKDKKIYTESLGDVGDIEPARILKIHKIKNRKKILKIKLKNGKEIKTTEDHLILIKREKIRWVEARYLKIGEEVSVVSEISEEKWKIKNRKSIRTKWEKIEKIVEAQKERYVYDLTVEKNHNYVANGIIVHNCHRCLKSYDYVFVVEQYRKQAANTRILGLTASPGSDAQVIKEICKNLGIEAVEIRTRYSEDVKEYLQELSTEIIKVDLPDEFATIRDLLAEIFKKRIEELKNRKILFLPATKKNLLELQHRIMRQIAAGNKHFNLLKGASVCAQAIKLQHALEMIETQGINSLYDYMKDLFEQAAQVKSQAVKRLVKQQEFNKAYILTSELSFKGIQHPKLIRLKEIIEKTIKEKRNARVIVFSQYRNTAVRICKELNALEGIRAKVFLGQAMKDGHGLTQKEQQEIINEFSLGQVNILVATSIGEEGLDLPEVNLVIFYEPIPSAIRKIQRSGRTARLMPGKLIILVTRKTRDEAYHYASLAKERKMYGILNNIHEELNNINKNNKKKQPKLSEFGL